MGDVVKTNPRPATHVVTYSRDGRVYGRFEAYEGDETIGVLTAAWQTAHFHVDVQVIDHQPIPDGLRDPDTEVAA